MFHGPGFNENSMTRGQVRGSRRLKASLSGANEGWFSGNTDRGRRGRGIRKVVIGSVKARSFPNG